MFLRLKNKKMREKILRWLSRLCGLVSTKERESSEDNGYLSLTNQRFHNPSEGSPEYFLYHRACRVRMGLIVSVLSGVSLFSRLIIDNYNRTGRALMLENSLETNYAEQEEEAEIKITMSGY